MILRTVFFWSILFIFCNQASAILISEAESECCKDIGIDNVETLKVRLAKLKSTYDSLKKDFQSRKHQYGIEKLIIVQTRRDLALLKASSSASFEEIKQGENDYLEIVRSFKKVRQNYYEYLLRTKKQRQNLRKQQQTLTNTIKAFNDCVSQKLQENNYPDLNFLNTYYPEYASDLEIIEIVDPTSASVNASQTYRVPVQDNISVYDGVWDIEMPGNPFYSDLVVSIYQFRGLLSEYPDFSGRKACRLIGKQQYESWVTSPVWLSIADDGSLDITVGKFGYCNCRPYRLKVRASEDTNVLVGQWTYENESGMTRWYRRPPPKINKLSIYKASILDGKYVSDNWLFGQRAGRVEREHPVDCGYGDMRGNCQSFWITLLGDNFAGVHTINWMDPAQETHMELNRADWVCKNGNYHTTSASPFGCGHDKTIGDQTAGIRIKMILRAGIEPGERILMVGGQKIPINLTIHGHPEQKKCPKKKVDLIVDEVKDTDTYSIWDWLGMSDAECSKVNPQHFSEEFNKLSGKNIKLKDLFENYLMINPQVLGFEPKGSALNSACHEYIKEKTNDLDNAKKEEIETYLTAEYYVSKKRLTDGILSTLQSIASMDKVLGMLCSDHNFGISGPVDLLADEVAQPDYSLVPGAEELIDKLQKCKDPVDYSKVITNTELAIVQLEHLRDELQKVESRIPVPNVNSSIYIGKTYEEKQRILDEHKSELPHLKEQKAKLLQFINTIEGTSPWVRGDVFKEKYIDEYKHCLREFPEEDCNKVRKKFICQAIKVQAAENKIQLKRQLNEYLWAMRCLEGLTECDNDKLFNIVRNAPQFYSTPSPPDLPENANKSESLDWLQAKFASNVLDVVVCNQKKRGYEEEFWRGAEDLAIDIGLTAVTGCLASVATIARAGKAGKAFLTAKNAWQLEAAALFLDVADAARNFYIDYDRCDNPFTSFKESRASTGSNNKCFENENFPDAGTIQNYNECLLKAIGSGLVNLGLIAAPAGINFTRGRAISRLPGTASEIRSAEDVMHDIRKHQDLLNEMQNKARLQSGAYPDKKYKDLNADLTQRQEIFKGLNKKARNDPGYIRNLSEDDIKFLSDPAAKLTDEQIKSLRENILDKYTWPEITKKLKNGEISEIEMHQLVHYRKQEVDKLVKESIEEVEKKLGLPKKSIKSNAFGSTNLTSDYDLSVEGPGAELVIRKFNDKFRKRFGDEIGVESGTYFDTNVYTDPAYKSFYTADSDLDKMLPPELRDATKQFEYDQMATRKYSTDQQWENHKKTLLENVPEESRDMVERVLKNSEMMHEEAYLSLTEKRLQLMKKRELTFEELKLDDNIKDDLFLRAENELYADNLEEIHRLRVEQQRIEEMGSPGFNAKSSEPDFLKQNPLYEHSLKNIEEAIQAGKMDEVEEIKKYWQHEFGSKIREKQGQALYFASEAYQTQGAIDHVVGELQGASNFKKELSAERLKGPRDADLSRPGRLTDEQYRNSYYENRANMQKELNHIRESRSPDVQKMAAKVGKYFPRQLDAAWESGINLTQQFQNNPELEDIIELAIEVDKRRSNSEDIHKFLKSQKISEVDFVKRAEKASEMLSAEIIKNMFIELNKH